MRLIFCLALLVFAPAASAAIPSKGAPRQFLDQSIVTYPKSLGRYRLVGADYDPAHVANGIGLDYTRTDVPGLQLDIYVYPRGRAEEAQAVTEAMVEIEGEIRGIERQKTYGHVQFGDAVKFAVASPSASAANVVGRKRALTMTIQATPAQSLAYVFYRNLFLISVRATAPAAAVSAADFNAVVDRAVQDLEPAIDIRNFGTCGNITIFVDPNSSGQMKQTAENASQMTREMARLDREHCAGSPGTDDTKPAKGYAQKIIVYPAGAGTEHSNR